VARVRVWRPSCSRIHSFGSRWVTSVPLLISTATIVLSTRKRFIDSRGHTRLFWILMTAGLVDMWWFQPGRLGLVLRLFCGNRFPILFYGDIILFLHGVPFMAAGRDSSAKSGSSRRRVVRCFECRHSAGVVGSLSMPSLFFPDEYVVRNIRVWSVRWDLLLSRGGTDRHCRLRMVLSSPVWEPGERSIAISCSPVSSMRSRRKASMPAIARGTYVSGGLHDVPFLISFARFFSGVARAAADGV